MPYYRDGLCVYKRDTGEKVGCSDTVAEAESYLRKLNMETANEGKATTDEKMVMRPTQAEAQYTPVSVEVGKACGNCRWFDGHMSMCALIENYPEDILPNGYCIRWEGKPVMEEEPHTTIEAETVMVMPPMEHGEMARVNPYLPTDYRVRLEDKAGRVLSKVSAGKVNAAMSAMMSAMTSIKDLLMNAGLMKEGEDPGEAMGKGSFSVFKANGKYYWKAVWSNNFKDLEAEILSQKAHDRYLARVEKKLISMPELWYWHIPGTKHGKALWLGRVDHLMLAVGAFDDTPLAEAFIKSYRKSHEKVSHGFFFPKWAKKDGVYLDYNTFEISPLLPDAAANPYTSFEEIIDMAITEAQRTRLEQILGKEKAAEILSGAEQTSKALEASGLAYKEYADIPAAEKAAASQPSAESKALDALMAALEGQAELIDRQDKLEAAGKGYALKFEALEKAQAEQKAANEALAKDNADLREKMKMTPRASQSDATVVTDPAVRKTMEERVSDFDPFFGNLKVPKGAGNNG